MGIFDRAELHFNVKLFTFGNKRKIRAKSICLANKCNSSMDAPYVNSAMDAPYVTSRVQGFKASIDNNFKDGGKHHLGVQLGHIVQEYEKWERLRNIRKSVWNSM
jgi:hypothetical protein